jgi:hypothetical protein
MKNPNAGFDDIKLLSGDHVFGLRPNLAEVFAQAADLLSNREDYLVPDRKVNALLIDGQEITANSETAHKIRNSIIAEYTGSRIAEGFTAMQIAVILNFALAGNSFGTDTISFQPDSDLKCDRKQMMVKFPDEIFPISWANLQFSTLYIKQTFPGISLDATFTPLFFINGPVVGDPPTFSLQAHSLAGLRNTPITSFVSSKSPFTGEEILGLSLFLRKYFESGFPVVSQLLDERGVSYPNPYNSDAEFYPSIDFFKADPAAYAIRNKLAEFIVLMKKSFSERNDNVHLISIIDQLEADIENDLASKGIEDIRKIPVLKELDWVRPLDVTVGIAKNMGFLLKSTGMHASMHEMLEHLEDAQSVTIGDQQLIKGKRVSESDVPFWTFITASASLGRQLALFHEPDEEQKILQKYGLSGGTFD